MDDDTRRLELLPSLRQLCHPDLEPMFWLPERRGVESAWWGHVPFAHWVMRATIPRVMVELGTHHGVSYAGFCNAVVQAELNTRCFAVDTWKGDSQASLYDERVYEDLKLFHDERYAAFSTLLRCTFDEALAHFADGSVDLLHIDGLHTYEAVKHDFESWKPKLSSRGFVLFHDIDVRHDDFGVWRLWRELSDTYPHFAFNHCYGLGVLAVGERAPDAIIELCALNDSHIGGVLRYRVAAIGGRWEGQARERYLLNEIGQERQALSAANQVAADAAHAHEEIARRLADAEKTIQTTAAEAAQLRAEIGLLSAEAGGLIAAPERADFERPDRTIPEEATPTKSQTDHDHARELSRRLAEANALAEQRYSDILSMQAQNHLLSQRVQGMEHSTIWRATSVVRQAVARFPQPVKKRLKNAARVGYWILTPQRTPERIRYLRQRWVKEPPDTAMSATLQPLVEVPAPKSAPIVFISGFPDSPGETYRIKHPQTVLGEEVQTLHITVNEVEQYTSGLNDAEIIVLYRVAWTPEIAAIIAEARANNCLIVFDTDDYIFEPAIATPEIVDGMRMLSEAEQALYVEGVHRYRQTLNAADCCIVSTEFLAKKVRDLGKPAYVLSNAVTPAELGVFDQALRDRRQLQRSEQVRVGYAAGTRTHQQDFAVIVPVIAELLRENAQLILTIVGYLDVSEYKSLEPFAHRIEMRPAVAHHELPQELIRFDINIAPLQIGNPFCEAKSELKFFDAAFLEIPTVASATEPFCAAIEDGKTGFIARTGGEWQHRLRGLIDDPKLRIRLGKAARSAALRQFGPGRLRADVRRVFEEVRRHKQAITPPRYLGYDHFLHAINFPPVPLTPRLATQRTSRSLDIHWIAPDFSIGWGGMTNIFRIIQQLERFGHRNTLWVHNPPATLKNDRAISEYYHSLISDHFLPIAAEVFPLPRDVNRISGDAVIATDHTSAYPARAVANVGRRFYFLQDHEPEFSPSGYGALFARATYGFGFDALSNGQWLHELAQQYGMWSMKWEQAADSECYFFDAKQSRKPGHIAFYARRETPRRAVELGFLAFELLGREKVDFHVDMFGASAPPSNLPFSFTHHGVLSHAQLGVLYREASIGMVFSATNYSIIPREMMACGLPVLELNSESSRRSFAGAAALADPTPESVASHLKAMLRDELHRHQLAEQGRRCAAKYSWENSAREIEAALLSRLDVPMEDIERLAS